MISMIPSHFGFDVYWISRLQRRGAGKLTGENLKLVWAEFSTIS
jgi:hypothetical protein